MQVTSTCAEDLNDCVQAAADAAEMLEDSLAVLRGEALSDDDRSAEWPRCLQEAAVLSGSARGIAELPGLWPALPESRR